MALFQLAAEHFVKETHHPVDVVKMIPTGHPSSTTLTKCAPGALPKGQEASSSQL